MISKRYGNDSKPELKLNPLQVKMKEQIDSKVKDAIYTFVKTPCPVCGSEEFGLLSEKDRYGLFYSVVICRQCGLVQTNPRMTKESYDEFYNEEYRKLYNATEKPTELFFQRQYRRGQEIFGFLKSRQLLLKTNPVVVEIGCGAGGILHYFNEKGGQTYGVDLGEEYIAYGREKYDLNLRSGSLSDLELSKSPDVIIYAHVFEHILDLHTELKELKKLCNKDTVIYIEVPGIKYVHKLYNYNFLEYFQNAHTYHFSLTTLSNIMAKNGFDLICGDEFVRSAFRIREASTRSDFNPDFQPCMQYIRSIESKRFYHYFSKNYIKNVILETMKKLRLKN